MLVLLNVFEPDATDNEPVRVCGVFEKLEELLEYVAEFEGLEGDVAEDVGWWVESEDDSSAGNPGRVRPVGAWPVALSCGPVGGHGWYEAHGSEER